MYLTALTELLTSGLVNYRYQFIAVHLMQFTVEIDRIIYYQCAFIKSLHLYVHFIFWNYFYERISVATVHIICYMIYYFNASIYLYMIILYLYLHYFKAFQQAAVIPLCV